MSVLLQSSYRNDPEQPPPAPSTDANTTTARKRKKNVRFKEESGGVVAEVHTIENKRRSMLQHLFYSASEILSFKDEKFEEEAAAKKAEKEARKEEKKAEKEAKKAERKAKLAARRAARNTTTRQSSIPTIPEEKSEEGEHSKSSSIGEQHEGTVTPQNILNQYEIIPKEKENQTELKSKNGAEIGSASEPPKNESKNSATKDLNSAEQDLPVSSSHSWLSASWSWGSTSDHSQEDKEAKKAAKKAEREARKLERQTRKAERETKKAQRALEYWKDQNDEMDASLKENDPNTTLSTSPLKDKKGNATVGFVELNSELNSSSHRRTLKSVMKRLSLRRRNSFPPRSKEGNEETNKADISINDKNSGDAVPSYNWSKHKQHKPSDDAASYSSSPPQKVSIPTIDEEKEVEQEAPIMSSPTLLTTTESLDAGLPRPTSPSPADESISMSLSELDKSKRTEASSNESSSLRRFMQSVTSSMGLSSSTREQISVNNDNDDDDDSRPRRLYHSQGNNSQNATAGRGEMEASYDWEKHSAGVSASPKKKKKKPMRRQVSFGERIRQYQEHQKQKKDEKKKEKKRLKGQQAVDVRGNV